MVLAPQIRVAEIEALSEPLPVPQRKTPPDYIYAVHLRQRTLSQVLNEPAESERGDPELSAADLKALTRRMAHRRGIDVRRLSNAV